LATGDIAVLSYSPGGSMRRELTPAWYILRPPFLGKGRSYGSAMIPFERAIVVSYRLSIVTIALSITIRPQFAVEWLRPSGQQWAILGQNFWGRKGWPMYTKF